MTAPDWPALGRRALAAGFALADGVLLRDGGRDVRVYGVRTTEAGSLVFYGAGWIDDPCYWRDKEWRPWWPDFSDPATLGVLEAQVRAAHNRTDLYAIPQDIAAPSGGFVPGWGIWRPAGRYWHDSAEPVSEGETLAAAWIAALEAAKASS